MQGKVRANVVRLARNAFKWFAAMGLCLSRRRLRQPKNRPVYSGCTRACGKT